MKNTDKISTAAALELAEDYGVSVSKVTMVTWCRERKIGIQVGGRGPWYIYKKRLIWLLEGREWKSSKEDKEVQEKK